MSGSGDVSARLSRRVACHQRVHDPACEPRNRLRGLPGLRRWQAARLRRSFAEFLDDPRRSAAAEFFLSDVYGDRDFTRRDADIARVVPMMGRLLPEKLLGTIAGAIELGALSHMLDLRVAQALEAAAGQGVELDEVRYAEAYRKAGLPRLRGYQIDLIEEVGHGFGRAVAMPGTGTLLKVSRRPARLAGLESLQSFLERGHAAFGRLGDAGGFVDRIARDERLVSARLFAADTDPFRFGKPPGHLRR